MKKLKESEEVGKEKRGWERLTEIYQGCKSRAYDLPPGTIFFLYMFGGS